MAVGRLKLVAIGLKVTALLNADKAHQEGVVSAFVTFDWPIGNISVGGEGCLPISTKNGPTGEHCSPFQHGV